MRALGWTLLCAVLLLLLVAARGEDPSTPEGEWCRIGAAPGWMFRCPRRHEPAGDKFCCGTCKYPSCCASEELRLNQELCPSPSPVLPGEWITKTRRNNPPASEKTSLRRILFFSFVSFLFGITFILAVHHCKKRYAPRLRTFWHNNVVQAWNRNRDEPIEIFQMGVYRLPDIPDPVLHPPPPNVTIMPPNADNPQEKWAFSPAALAEFLQSRDAENREGEGAAAASAGAVGPLVHRNVPSQGSDTASEKETSL